MIRRARLAAGLLLLGAPLLVAQVPTGERIPITDPGRLEALGFARDAANVALWSRAYGTSGRADETPTLRSAEVDAGSNQVGFSTTLGYELEAEAENTKLGRFPQETECYGNQTNGGPTYAQARVQVPDGARLDFFRFWAQDSDPDLDLVFDVVETCLPVGYDPPATTLLAESFTFGAIGNYMTFASLHGLTANNRDCSYTVRVKFADSGVPCSLNLRVRKLQISWIRQVSPAPSTASFNDVPTNHPFFRFIEALRDSGITGGCSAAPALYCPDAPITRGQMAVFLATALGLSWP